MQSKARQRVRTSGSHAPEQFGGNDRLGSRDRDRIGSGGEAAC